MDILNASYIAEQNKIASSGAWIWLLEIATPGQTTLRYANNNSNIKWPSGDPETYYAMSFSMDDLTVSTSGEFPTYKLQLDYVTLNSDVRTQIKAVGGLVGSTVRLMVVHSEHLSLTTPAIDELVEILSCELTAAAVVFTIGIPSLLSKRFPRDRYVPSFCRHKFAGALCQYTQPDYFLTSTTISFIVGTDPDDPYNTIWVAEGGLITDVFSHAEGADQGVNYALTNDTAFTISGSESNDGLFLANNDHAVGDKFVRVFTEAQKGRAFVAESAGESITLKLGFDVCDHTLEACALRDNTQNYGGSPGIAGGMYG